MIHFRSNVVLFLSIPDVFQHLVERLHYTVFGGPIQYQTAMPHSMTWCPTKAFTTWIRIQIGTGELQNIDGGSTRRCCSRLKVDPPFVFLRGGYSNELEEG